MNLELDLNLNDWKTSQEKVEVKLKLNIITSKKG